MFHIEGLSNLILTRMVLLLTFLLQSFDPINLERKLEMEKERDMVKFMLDECIPHEFVRFMYKHKY